VLKHDSARFRTLLNKIHGKICYICASKLNSCRENTQLVKEMAMKAVHDAGEERIDEGHHAWREMM